MLSRSSNSTLIGIALVFLAGCGGEPSPSVEAGSPAASRPLTFNNDIGPIVFEHCAPCHRPEKAAPFSLLTYAEVKARSSRIADVTASRTMPPWMPEPGYGEFAGDRRLSDDEIARVRRWVEDGAVEGDPADLPPPPEWADGWQLGEPDLVIETPEPYTLRAGGSDVFRNFVIPVPIDSTRYVRAVELRPGNSKIVHHAVMMVDRTESSRRLDEHDPEPGYDGMHTALGEAHNPGGFFLGWTPGRVPFAGTADMAWRLEKGTDFVVQLHMRPTREERVIAAAVGFYFADRPPTRFPTMIRLGSETIDIPAGAANYEIKDTYVLPVDVEVLSIYPHAHYLGKVIESFATLPDGTRKWLIRITDWNFNRQDEYRYAQPIHLPRGTTLTGRIVYDNSSANPRNPNRPPRRVVYGPKSSDEMGDVWIQVVPRDSAHLAVLRKHYAYKKLVTQMAGFRQALRLNPDSAEMHHALGTTLHALGRVDEAVGHYRQALERKSDFAVVHYNLAVALNSRGEPDAAIRHFLRAVDIEPDLGDAHYQLGIALASRDKLDEAIEHLRQALRLNPERAEIHNSLGLALNINGQVEEALEHLRQASRLKPEWLPPTLELAWILATHPDPVIREPAEAVRLGERAAALSRRGDPVVLDVLAAAYAAAGQFDLAVRTAQNALALASVAGATELEQLIRQRLALYGSSQPYRVPAEVRPHGAAVR